MSICHRTFIGVDLFVIERLFLRFDGAYTTDASRQGLRAQVEASGPFFNKRTGDEYTFVTRAMSGMVYQYELDTGEWSTSTSSTTVSGLPVRA